MKSILASTGLTLAVCAFAFAQGTTGDRVVVPARNTSRPRVVNCKLMNGHINVKTYDGKEVIVEDSSSPRGPRTPPAPSGMKRIGMASRGLEVEEDDNVITVRNRGGNGNLTITVPVDTSLHLNSMSGNIDVDGVHGEVDVHTLNGHVTLTNITGTVTADSQNGPIKATMSGVDTGKPLAFSTLNGIIDVTFPADFKANLTVRSIHGPVYSDFDVTLGGNRAITEKNGSSDGLFRIRIDNTIRGTINGGGPDLTIRTLNGGVYLRKKK
jgi:Putative adhesin